MSATPERDEQLAKEARKGMVVRTLILIVDSEHLSAETRLKAVELLIKLGAI